MKKFTLALLAAFCCTAFFNPILAQEGSLDPTFGTNGKVWEVPVNGISNSNTQTKPKTLVQSTGKILQVYGTPGGGTTIVRYMPDGAVDVSFGVAGELAIAVANGLTTPRDAYMLPDDKFYIGGHTTASSALGYGVLKLNADGSRDNSFGNSGLQVITVNGVSNFNQMSITVDQSGRIVLVSTIANQIFLCRLLATGAMDTGFSGDGLLIQDFANSYEGGNDVAVHVDGRIYVAGYAGNTAPDPFGPPVLQTDPAVFCFNGNGTVHTSFGNAGVASVVNVGLTDQATGIVIDPFGNIVFGGHYEVRTDGDQTGFFIGRFFLNGTPDLAFGSGSGVWRSAAVGGRAWAVDLGAQEDGKILLGGTRLCDGLCTLPGRVDIYLYRFTVNGSPDASFAPSGLVTIAYAPFLDPFSQLGSRDIGGSFASQGTKLIVGGFAEHMGLAKNLVVRLNTSSPLVNNGIAATPFRTIPAKIEAEYSNDGEGTLISEPTSDMGGGLNLRFSGSNVWRGYYINVPVAGAYTINFRVASPNSGQAFQVLSSDPGMWHIPSANKLEATVSVPNTGSSQNWQTISVNISLPAGRRHIRLVYSGIGGYWNINWLEFVNDTNNYVLIPAKIEAENYIAMQGIQTENTIDAGGGLNVGYQDDGDWMDYAVNVPTAGTYNLNFRVATIQIDAQFQVKNSTGAVLTTVTVPSTGNWQGWTTVTAQATLPAGTQVLRIFTNRANGGWNINWWEIAVNTPPPPPPPPPSSINTRIEAENYAAMQGIQTENTTDTGGGLNVGYQDDGDWMDYTVNIPSAGTYNLNFRVATIQIDAQFQLRSNSGAVLTTVTVPSTGNWQGWTTVTTQATLPAGLQTLRIFTSRANGGWNINWWEIVSGTTTPPPPTTSTRIEAENFIAMQGIQTENTTDVGGGLNVGYQDDGDWMDYAVNVPSAGTYNLNFRVATIQIDAQFRVKNSAGAVLATVTVPSTGNWQGWVTVTAQATLPAGAQTLRIYTSRANGGWNINWWEITSGTTNNYVAIPSKIEAEDYNNMYGIRTEATADAGGSLGVSGQDNGDWMDYNINVPNAGFYLINFRTAVPNPNVEFQVRNGIGTVLSTVRLVYTGGFQAWQTSRTRVYLPAGQQTIRIQTTQANGGWNLNWMAFVADPFVLIPAKIEAERFSTAVRAIKIDDATASNQSSMQLQSTNSLLTYRIFVPAEGLYQINLRVATISGVQIRIIDSMGIQTTTNLPNTGGYNNWQVHSIIFHLPAGEQHLAIVNLADQNWNLDWVEFISPSSQPTRLYDAVVKPVESKSTNDLKANIVLSPNPVQDQCTVQLNNDNEGAVLIDVVNVSGVVAKRFSFGKAKGYSTHRLNVGELAKGMYLLRVHMGGRTEVVKFMKL